MRVLSQNQFTQYANTQIEMASQILARHRSGTNRWCSCGKELPCAVAAHAGATRDRYQAKLALLDATKALPGLAPTAEARPVRGWLRLLGCLR